MTRIVREGRTWGTVSVMIAILVMAFPFAALKFKPASTAEVSASAAYVLLSADEAEAALKAAKTWQMKGESNPRLRMMQLTELPDETAPDPLELRTSSAYVMPEARPIVRGLPPFRLADIPKERTPLPPLKAPSPKPETPAFSREELLTL